MYFRLFIALIVVACCSLSLAVDVGDSLWETFVHTRELPTSADKADDFGFKRVSSSCDPKLGILYARGSAATEDHPLGLYFTAGGQIAGLQANIWGSNKQIGSCAPANLISQGYWKPAANNQSFSIDISFRAPAAMCAEDKSDQALGDRVVINQDSIARSIPLSEGDAKAQNYYRGSCMKNMGTHYFYDLKSAPHSSWEEDQLMPIVPMYHPDTGRLHAFFFTTPVAQKGSKDLLFAKGDWEAPSLSPHNMCQNWCDESCTWKTAAWSTMHIYLSSAWEALTCPNGTGMFNRSCDL